MNSCSLSFFWSADSRILSLYQMAFYTCKKQLVRDRFEPSSAYLSCQSTVECRPDCASPYTVQHGPVHNLHRSNITEEGSHLFSGPTVSCSQLGSHNYLVCCRENEVTSNLARLCWLLPTCCTDGHKKYAFVWKLNRNKISKRVKNELLD